jgi:hypothetical protein
MQMTQEDMLRKIMQSAKMVRPEDMAGMTATAGPIENLQITAKMSGTTPDGGVDNVAEAIADAGTSPEGLAMVQEGMSGEGMSFDPAKFAEMYAAMPSAGPVAPEMLGLIQGAGFTPMQAAPTNYLTPVNAGLMDLLRAQQQGRM